MALVLAMKTGRGKHGVTTSIDGPIHIINEDTGEEGIIDISSIDRNSIKIAIDLPSNYTILRDKVYQEQMND